MLSVISDVKGQVTSTCYSNPDRKVVGQLAIDKLVLIAKYIGTKDTIVGKAVTIADFLAFEVIDQFNWISEGDVFKTYPNLEAYHGKIAAIP